MTYTAEQLRRDAIAIERMHGETLTVEWRDHQAGLLRAFAAALEENARLTRECEFHAKQCARVDELRHRAEAELAALREQLAEARAEIAALKGHAVEPRIGLNSDGSLDEVVGSPGHIEQLDSGDWFVEIGEYAIWLHAKGKIVAHHEHRAAYPKE